MGFLFYSSSFKDDANYVPAVSERFTSNIIFYIKCKKCVKSVIARYGSRCGNNEYILSSKYYNFFKIIFTC